MAVDVKHVVATTDWRLHLGWGIGTLGASFLLNAFAALQLYYLTDLLGIAIVTASGLLLIAKLWDWISNPLMGMISDRTHTRWGRRRPFLFAGALICGAGLFYIFNAPSAHPVALLVGLMLMSVGYSLFNIPYIAMPAEMTDSPVERTAIMSWRVAFVGVGTMIAMSLLPLLIKHWGGDRAAYGLMGSVAAGLTVITMLATFAGSTPRMTSPSAVSTLSTRAADAFSCLAVPAASFSIQRSPASMLCWKRRLPAMS